ncbi:M67 family metallopeptidase [Stomatohabitans albus]|uniref:M67 family metallopeptidase n=1 Tax=Stomatohabitans albus TaxID=3110766 RepID=UPI00300D8D3F
MKGRWTLHCRYARCIDTLGTPLFILSDIRTAIIRHAVATQPNEGCGLLGDDGDSDTITRHVIVPSADPSPVRFTMEPYAQLNAHHQIEQHGGRWRAIWHSHPTSAAYPSPTDRAQSLNWAGIVAIIVSLAQPEPVIRAFSIIGGREVVEHPLRWVQHPLP